jgi:hypothetical protein
MSNHDYNFDASPYRTETRADVATQRIADSAAAEIRRADQRVRDIMAAALEQVRHIGENLPSAGYAERHNRYYDFMQAVDGAVADNMPEVE